MAFSEENLLWLCDSIQTISFVVNVVLNVLKIKTSNLDISSIQALNLALLMSVGDEQWHSTWSSVYIAWFLCHHSRELFFSYSQSSLNAISQTPSGYYLANFPQRPGWSSSLSGRFFHLCEGLCQSYCWILIQLGKVLVPNSRLFTIITVVLETLYIHIYTIYVFIPLP